MLDINAGDKQPGTAKGWVKT